MPPTAAERMRSYRKRRRDGMHYVRIPLHVTEIDDLVRMGLLKQEQRQDVEALQIAVLGLVYRGLEDPKWRVTGAARWAPRQR
jgi:hypothetical protein